MTATAAPVAATEAIRLAAMATELDAARLRGTKLELFSARGPLSLKDAYVVQRAGLAMRLARRERVVGAALAVEAESFGAGAAGSGYSGYLTDAMALGGGGKLKCDAFGGLAAVPHLAIVLKDCLHKPLTLFEATAATEAVAPAIQLVDGRFRDHGSEQDTDRVADNGSTAAFAIGVARHPTVDLANLGFVFAVNGRAVHHGSTAAVRGHPLRALVALSRILSEHGEDLPAGAVVLTGAAAPPTVIAPGDWVELQMATMERMGFTAG